MNNKELDRKLMHYTNERTQSLDSFYKAGFINKDSDFSFQKTFDTLTQPQSFQTQFKNFFSNYLDAYLRGSAGKLWFPFDMMAPFFDTNVEESYNILTSLFKNEINEEHLFGYDTDYLAFTTEANYSTSRRDYSLYIERENALIHDLILSMVETLSQPTEILTFIEDNFHCFSFPIENYEMLIKALKKKRLPFRSGIYSCSYLVWPQGILEMSCGEDGKLYDSTLYINKEHKSIINSSLQKQAVLHTSNNFSFGELKASFPLNSFNPETRELSSKIAQARTNSNKTSVLIQGEPGTGKTEWAKSYTAEVLSKEGFFTYFMDASTIQKFSPNPNIPKVCIILNEVDNLIKDRGDYDDYNSGVREALLGFFDGSVYNSILPASSSDYEQEVVILLTCNTTLRMDPAFLRKGRVDLIQEFTHKYVPSS